MYPDSRQTIHIGINFLVAPMPTIDAQSNLSFQQFLIARGVDFSRIELRERQGEIIVGREAPTLLEIRVAAHSHTPLGQLLILAPHLGCDLELFSREAEAIVEAFSLTWPADKRQIISSDATLRDLFETSAEHAFQELWEGLLDQSPEKLAGLGRPVLGGGLRLVMPPKPDEPEPTQIEVKIESFLQDTKKIFVETQFTWRPPMLPDASFNPSKRLKQIDEYVEDRVIPLVMGGCR